MKSFDVQGIELRVPFKKAFTLIGDPNQLPGWTRAFARVANGRAVMRTPKGEVEIDLAVRASADQGTVDWEMTFPDGSAATAFSRLVGIKPDVCVYSFILTPPPVPLEELEGALEAQSNILTEELRNLKGILERND